MKESEDIGRPREQFSTASSRFPNNAWGASVADSRAFSAEDYFQALNAPADRREESTSRTQMGLLLSQKAI